MEIIQFKDIDFSKLQILPRQGSKSLVYRDESNCYKILDGLYDYEKDELYEKLLDLDDIKIDNVLLPKKLIFKENRLYGYTMDYFSDSVSLYDKFMDRYVDLKKLFDYVFKASKILRSIHSEGIICKDFSFDNVLVNESGNVAFCDLDGCCYGNHVGPFISMLMKRFFVDFRKEEIFLSDNLDRVSMLISFYYLIYAKELQYLTEEDFQKLSDRIITFKNLRVYADRLLDIKTDIGNIPYLDELIDVNDGYVYDREKCFCRVRR